MMPNYIIPYHSGKKFENPEEGAKYKQQFQAWVGGLGACAHIDCKIELDIQLRNLRACGHLYADNLTF
jgi:hypothetical protein